MKNRRVDDIIKEEVAKVESRYTAQLSHSKFVIFGLLGVILSLLILLVFKNI